MEKYTGKRYHLHAFSDSMLHVTESDLISMGFSVEMLLSAVTTPRIEYPIQLPIKWDFQKESLLSL